MAGAARLLSKLPDFGPVNIAPGASLQEQPGRRPYDILE